MQNWELYGVSLAQEFASELGDPRRTERLIRSGTRISERPEASFLEIFDDPAEREGFYRLVRNEHVELAGLLSAHQVQTANRCAEFEEVLVIHDTTEFRFPLTDGAVREGLHTFSKTKQGFRGHFSMAASADGLRIPLGTVGFRGFVPSSADADVSAFWDDNFDELVNLNDRWWDAIVAAEDVLSDSSVIHVADREADFFSLVGLMQENDCRYVVRAKHNRRANKTDSDVIQTLNDVLSTSEFVAHRKIELSARAIADRPPTAKKKQPPRARRTAELDFRYTRVTLQPPPNPDRSTAINQPAEYRPIEVTAIEVLERDPPEGETAVRWVLLTSDLVGDVEHLMRVVDMYRTRWLIEEFFKAIKTGCAYQKRQMSSASTLLAALAILLPTAWRLLMLRHLERHCPELDADALLSQGELHVLRLKSKKNPLPRSPSISDACLAIARLGGHVKQNGPPGWQVLGRGFQKLLTLAEGYELLRQEMDL